MNECLDLMSRSTLNGVEYAPCYRYQIRLIQPRKLVEAEKFNIQYPSKDSLSQTADKLRWARYRMGLLQSDVAQMTGVHRSTYLHYENGETDYFQSDFLHLAAEKLGVDYEWLLDDYNRFLEGNPAKWVKALRETSGLSVNEFAVRLEVYPQTVRKWEQGDTRISKSAWEHLKKFSV